MFTFVAGLALATTVGFSFIVAVLLEVAAGQLGFGLVVVSVTEAELVGEFMVRVALATPFA